MTEEIIIDGVDVAGCEHFKINRGFNCYKGYNCTDKECSDCYYKELKHLQRENKEKIDIIEQMIKILYPNSNDDELYDATFNGEYIDELKELKDTADTMLMANDIKKLDIDSLREANDRLEQERDELKFENDRYKQLLKGCPTEDEDCGLCVIDEQNKRLKQENKDLKKQIESDKGLITIGGKQQYKYLQRIDELEQENEKWKEARNHFMAENLKYFNALEEIITYLNTLSSIDSDFTNTETYLRIQDKINEVLDDRI